MKIKLSDKILINNFLNQTIDINEFNDLYILILEIVEIINSKASHNKFNKFNLEILDAEDGIYKKIKINLKDKSVCIELCENLENKYFVAKSITFLNENNIEFTKRLVKTTYPQNNIFMELALKRWKYNGYGVSIKHFEEIDNIDYTKELPIYSISEYNEKIKHYTRCLSKNKNG